MYGETVFRASLSSYSLSCRSNALSLLLLSCEFFPLITLPPSVGQPVGLSKWWKQLNFPVLPSLYAAAGKRKRRRRREKTLSADSVENNEGGRLLQWGAAVLNMENHMQHIHLHLSNASQQGTQGLAPVEKNIPCTVCATNTSVAYATDNFETINTFDGNLIRKIIDNYGWEGTLSAKTKNLFANKVVFHPSR